jgi:hypothetical protein
MFSAECIARHKYVRHKYPILQQFRIEFWFVREFSTSPQLIKFVRALVLQAVDLEGLDMELDLTNLGTINPVFAALLRRVTKMLDYSCH